MTEQPSESQAEAARLLIRMLEKDGEPVDAELRDVAAAALPSPDAPCRCGHGHALHVYGSGKCVGRACGCRFWRSTERPVSRPAFYLFGVPIPAETARAADDGTTVLEPCGRPVTRWRTQDAKPIREKDA